RASGQRHRHGGGVPSRRKAPASRRGLSRRAVRLPGLLHGCAGDHRRRGRGTDRGSSPRRRRARHARQERSERASSGRRGESQGLTVAMKIHEYQGKQIFAKYGIPIPKGIPAFSVDEAAAAAKKLIAETGSEVCVVKAQIHAGGRGKGGGVKVVKGAAAVRETAAKMLGMQLVTHQTGPEGQKVRRLYIEQGLDIKRELYVGLVVDR